MEVRFGSLSRRLKYSLKANSRLWVKRLSLPLKGTIDYGICQLTVKKRNGLDFIFLDPDGMKRKDSIGQAGFTRLTAPVKLGLIS